MPAGTFSRSAIVSGARLLGLRSWRSVQRSTRGLSRLPLSLAREGLTSARSRHGRHAEPRNKTLDALKFEDELVRVCYCFFIIDMSGHRRR